MANNRVETSDEHVVSRCHVAKAWPCVSHVTKFIKEKLYYMA